MLQQRWSLVGIAIVACCLQAQGADKYNDENRPYEFGFTIDGEQHRHEKKDENGLIMGEFGFITADGVYHVTVYATDENGNFKILSMKNIRVKPYPTAPEKKGHSLAPEKKGHSLPFPPSQNPPKTEGPSLQKPKIAVSGLPQASPARSCSSCSIPTTTTKKPQLTDLAVVSKDSVSNQFSNNGAINPQYPQGGTQTYPNEQQTYPSPNDVPSVGGQQNRPNGSSPTYPNGGTGTQPNIPQTPGIGKQQNYQPPGIVEQSKYPQRGQSYPQQGSSGPQEYPQQGQNYPQQGSREPQEYSQHGQNYPQQGSRSPQENPQSSGGRLSPGPTSQDTPGNTLNDRNPKQFTDYPEQPIGQSQEGPHNNLQGNGNQYRPQNNDRPSKPTLITAQMQIVDKDTDIYQKKPGEKDGLPNGLSKDDMLRLLYTFNYTVGFHGHFEEGYTNGAKQGYYYITGRNGVRTRVDYVADEKGFRPKISQEVLDLLSDDVPKPETEKDEKYGLKGYEFKWLYYPVESSNRS